MSTDLRAQLEADAGEDQGVVLPDRFGDPERIAARIEESHAMVQIIAQTRDYINALPNTKNDARKAVAMARFSDSFAMELPEAMTLDLYQAAMLIGRGLTHTEAADAVGMDLPTLYQNMGQEFRRVTLFWYRRTFEEYFSTIIRMIDYLVETVNEPKLMLKLLQQMESLANRAEDRERWETEIILREREIRAKEKESDAIAGHLRISTVVRAETLSALEVEAEFEAEDVSD